jgi:protein-tyrosine phosphatase
VYVHCWGGAGRTGLVIGAWLVRHGMAGDAALAEVQRLYDGTRRPGDRRRRSPETWEQQEYVRRWAEYEAAWGARDGTSQAAGVRTRLQRWRERVSGR